MFKKHEIKTIDDFGFLREKWIYLEKGKDMTVFQSYNWNLLLFEQLLREHYNRLFVSVAVYESDKIIVPLIIQKKSVNLSWPRRKKGAYILGDGSYSDYLNMVYSDINDSECLSFINSIKEDIGKLPLNLSYIREGTLLFNLMQKKKMDAIHKIVSVEVRLPESEEEYEKILSKNTRQNLRTSLNRINRDSVEYKNEILYGKIDETLADELVPIHLNRVLEINSHGNGIKKKISNWIRCRRLIHIETCNNVINWAMKKMDNSVLVACRINGSIAGYLYGLSETDSIRILQNCFVDDYKFYSPMFRGTYDFIKKLISDSNVKCIDFTRGDEEYKYKLGGIEVNLYSFKIESNL